MTLSDLNKLSNLLLGQGVDPLTEIVVEDDGGISSTVRMVLRERWGEHGQLEISRHAFPMRPHSERLIWE